jgi:predicted HTH domain antitoxin
MQITVQLPDDVAEHPNAGREALEAMVIEGYRTGALSHHQASQILGLWRFDFDRLLKERQIFDHAYDETDLKQDMETLDRLRDQDHRSA